MNCRRFGTALRRFGTSTIFKDQHGKGFFHRNSICNKNIYSKTSRISLLGSSLFFAYLLSGYTLKSENKNGQLKMEDTVSIDSSISPFKVNLNQNDYEYLNSDFQLLGRGVRSVTFIRFKVYGIGLYIAKNDIAKTRAIIQDFSSDPLETILDDKIRSQELVSNLLDSNIRFAVRICPLRNTDFNHIKDGLIKSILAYSGSNNHTEALGRGLAELREAFSKRRGSIPKNNAIWIEILENKGLNIFYEDAKKSEFSQVGKVSTPEISKFLFIQYMSGPKPLSDSLKKSCTQGLSSL